MNPSDARLHMQKRKALESSIHRKTVQHSMSMFANAGECQSRFMMPLNANTNDTTAAMHMLTLTNWAAYSREHLCGAPMDLNTYDSRHESEFHYADINAYKHPWINGNPDQELQPGNSCKPIRPIPRVDALDSLLHEELSTNSNNCRAPCSFKDGHSNQLSSFKTNGPLKMKDLESNSQAKKANCQTSTSRDEKSEHIVASSDSHPHARGSQGRIAAASSTGIKSKGRTAHPCKSAYSTTICVFNRNPAGFASPNEESEYMAGFQQERRRRAGFAAEDLEIDNDDKDFIDLFWRIWARRRTAMTWLSGKPRTSSNRDREWRASQFTGIKSMASWFSRERGKGRKSLERRRIEVVIFFSSLVAFKVILVQRREYESGSPGSIDQHPPWSETVIERRQGRLWPRFGWPNSPASLARP